MLDGAALCAELLRPLEALRALAPQARLIPLWRKLRGEEPVG